MFAAGGGGDINAKEHAGAGFTRIFKYVQSNQGGRAALRWLSDFHNSKGTTFDAATVYKKAFVVVAGTRNQPLPLPLPPTNCQASDYRGRLYSRVVINRAVSLNEFYHSSVVEPLLQVHSGAQVDRMTLLGSDISLYAGAQPITEQQLGAMHYTRHDTLKVTRQLYLLIY